MGGLDKIEKYTFFGILSGIGFFLKITGLCHFFEIKDYSYKNNGGKNNG